MPIKTIKNEFKTWDGFELHSITYASDDNSNDDNVVWMNELAGAHDLNDEFTQCIMFESDFLTPKDGGGSFNPSQEYTGWQWWLAKSTDGKWKLMTWGY